MERLTDKCWRNLDPWECCGQDYYCKRGCHEEGGCTKGCIVPKLYARLAAYEDTGLEPEDVMRCVDILHAEEEGRLVVLLCKVGDTVYFASWFGTGPHIVERVIDPYFYTKDARDMGSTADFLLKDFGKIVFHTRKESEEALRKENQGDA